MTQSAQPDDPTTVAETAAGSVEYGGNQIHADAPADGPDAGAVTSEAGTFTDLPVTPDEQAE
jgi:hypothetical protein